jgi:hypothetical protein
MRYFIVRDANGAIIDTRSSQSRVYSHYVQDGPYGPGYTSRRDLAVKKSAGTKPILDVTEITAAEYRALTVVKNEAVEKLRQDVERAEASLASAEKDFAKAAAFEAASRGFERRLLVPEYSLTNAAQEQMFVPAEHSYNGKAYWAWSGNYENDARRCEGWVFSCQKKLANYRKRLAAASRKAAKA